MGRNWAEFLGWGWGGRVDGERHSAPASPLPFPHPTPRVFSPFAPLGLSFCLYLCPLLYVSPYLWISVLTACVSLLSEGPEV